MVQIETLAALEQLPEIAAVPGVDSIFIGPADLSASMGHLGDIGNADVQDDAARRRAASAGSSASRCGIIGANPELVAQVRRVRLQLDRHRLRHGRS